MSLDLFKSIDIISPTLRIGGIFAIEDRSLSVI